MSETAKFDPKKYMIKVKGKDYLEVKFRVHWFRLSRPQWDIKTEIVKFDINKGIAVVRADIYDEKGNHRSSGMKMEYQKNFGDYLEKAETGAIGRSVSSLGYGTLQCFDLEEGTEKGRLCDAPMGDEKIGNGSTPASSKQKSFIHSLIKSLELTKEEALKIFFDCARREINSTTQLTSQEASGVIEYLKDMQAKVSLGEPAGAVTGENGNPFIKLIPISPKTTN